MVVLVRAHRNVVVSEVDDIVGTLHVDVQRIGAACHGLVEGDAAVEGGLPIVNGLSVRSRIDQLD